MKKRILSILLTLVMVIGMLPTVAFAATPTVTWNNQTFSTQQELDDNTVLELVGDNTINIDGEIVSDHNDDYYGIDGSTNLTIQGNGTLTINMKNITVPSEYDIDRLELIGLQATNLTIEGNVKIVINIENAAISITGISGRTISVEDAANLDITVANTRNGCDATGIYASRWASLTSTKTTDVKVSVNSTTSAELGRGILVDGIDVGEENNGNLTIKNGTVNISLNNSADVYGFVGTAISSSTFASAEGEMMIKNAKINTTTNEKAIQQNVITEESQPRATATDTLVIENSTINIGECYGGIKSAFNGIKIQDSELDIVQRDYGANPTIEARALKIVGASDVYLEPDNENPVWVPEGYIDFQLTSGGKFEAYDGSRTNYEMFYVKLGTDNNVTIGSIDYSNNCNDDLATGFATADGRKFVVVYGSAGGGGEETAEIDLVNVTVTEPSANADAVFDATDDHDGCSITDDKITWMKDGTTQVNAGAKFAPNTTYSCFVALSAEDGYKFTSDTKVYINGKEATYVRHGDEYAHYYYDFTTGAAEGGDETEVTATVTDINVTGTVDTDITVQEFRIYVDGDTFGMSIPANITDWFKNIPTGLKVEKIECAGVRLTVRVSGTPTAVSDEAMEIVIPAEYLTSSTTDVTVTTNANAKYSIVAGSITPPTEYDITVTGGTASATKAVAGTEITLTVDESAIPAGQVFDKWEVVSGGVTVTEGKFTMPANAVEIRATYKDAPVVPTEYDITVTGGTASANKATAGTVITLTVDESTIPAGQVFDKWEVVSGGVTITDGKFTMPANTVAIKATYKDAPVIPTEYNITVTGGTASANKAVAGTVITLTVDESAIPAGQVFDKWEVVSGGVTITDGKFTMPESAVEIRATYKDIPVTYYTVTYTDGVDGTVFENQTFTVKEGAATPAFEVPEREGYNFMGWSPEVAETVTESITYTAVWEKDKWDVKYPPVFIVTDDTTAAMMPEKDVLTFADAVDLYQVQIMAQSGSFIDVAKADWFYSDVTALVSKGIINGYPDGSFRPQGEVTWGEALKLVMKAVSYGDIAPTNDHWASGYMETALDDLLISCEVDLDAAITREEVANLTAQALKLAPAGIAYPFDDAAPESAVALYAAGIINGSADNGQLLFRAESTITRAEMAAIIWRVYCAR